jgi:peptidoglycan hydrolase-like protein with peptidoglycan-binding domain
MSSTNKIVAAAVGFSLAFAAFVGVGAASAGAQAMTLSQLVDLFISLGIISSDKAAAAKAAVTTAAPAMTFSKDLTIGSTGADVSALQAAVGVTPATGYFGSATAAAVKKFQTSKGISATGYVGPLTRAALSGSAAMTTTTTTTTTTGGTTSTVVNTGVEGTLTVNKASVSNTTIYEGESGKSVIGLKIEAKLSDISIQRVKLNLGNSTKFYTKLFKSLSLTDDSGKVIARADLNSNTVVKDGSSYFLTLGGFNYVVAKDSVKYLWVKADAYSSIDSADMSSQTITVGIDGVRGTDGAGIDQLSPSSAFSQQITLSNSLTGSASLDLSLNSASVKVGEVTADQGSINNEADKVDVLSFDIRANKDAITVNDLALLVTKAGNSFTIPTVYLYEGSNLIASESLNGNVVSFTDINNLVVAKDATKTLTVKVDVRDIATTSPSTPSTVVVSATSTSFSVENSIGEDGLTVSGSAVGNTQTIRAIGPVFALNSKSITVSGTNNSGSTLSTSTVSATFSVTVTAKGGDIYFGNQASSSNKMFKFALYNASGAAAANTVATTSEGFTIPSSGVTTVGTDGFKLSKNNSVTIDGIKVDIAGKGTDGQPILGTAVGISAIQWSTTAGVAPTVSNFMSGKTEWRTNTQNP